MKLNYVPNLLRMNLSKATKNNILRGKTSMCIHYNFNPEPILVNGIWYQTGDVLSFIMVSRSPYVFRRKGIYVIA